MSTATTMGSTIGVTITGDRPLLMHNGQLANPLNPWAKRLKTFTSKRQKTDEDYIEIMRIEFMGGLYYDKKIGAYIPGINLEGCIWEGAKKKKRGTQVREGLTCLEDRVPLKYTGPRDPDAMWDLEEFRDVRGVKLNGKSTMMRCRPVFRDWSLSFGLSYFPDVIDPESIREALDDAGRRIGLGDYHYRFGKFSVTGWQVNG